MSHKTSSEIHNLSISTNTTLKITISSCPRTLKIYYTSLDGNTPTNVDYQIYNEGTLDILHLHTLEKLVKEVKYALADFTLLRVTNQELITANIRKQQKASRSGA